MKLNGKNILVISSNEWGAVFLSKHHYAVELARMGNNVYFLNPPNESLPERFRITKIVEHNLHVISYRSFPQSLRLRFHARFAYNIINKWYIKTILRKVNVKFDIAWCFDANLYDDLRMFGAPVIIYEPVDLVIYPYQLRIARHANIIVSISKSIIDAFREWPQPKLLVNHGLNPAFAADARKALAGLPESFVQPAKIRIGYVGNLVSPKFHRPYVRKMVTTYPQAE
ncbi:MAG TPA: hypothetical protein VD996_06245, partial [Chitinophagaceae bacterium]|nr:hypothetical protein [Chitinophagaceae bacterium]